MRQNALAALMVLSLGAAAIATGYLFARTNTRCEYKPAPAPVADGEWYGSHDYRREVGLRCMRKVGHIKDNLEWMYELDQCRGQLLGAGARTSEENRLAGAPDQGQ